MSAAPLAADEVVAAGLEVYDRCADRVHDLVRFVSRDSGLAAEVTRDVVVLAAVGGEAPADPEALLAWSYAQARTDVFARMGERGRTPPDERVVPVGPLPEDPTTADLGGLAYQAMAAFGERDLALIALHLRQGLEGEALAAAMGLSASAVEVLLPAAAARVEVQLRALLAVATGGCGCQAVRDLAAAWDGTFSPLVRRRAAEVAEGCCSGLAAAPPPLALLQAIPPVPAPAALRQGVEDRLRAAASAAAVPGAAAPGPAAGVPDGLPEGDDDTIPPGEGPPVVAAPAGPAAADDAPTIPPGVGPQAVVAVPAAPVASPAPNPGSTAPASAGRRSRASVPLAVALAVAVALVVAGAVFRAVAPEEDAAGDVVVAPAQPPAVAAPPSTAVADAGDDVAPPASEVAAGAPRPGGGPAAGGTAGGTTASTAGGAPPPAAAPGALTSSRGRIELAEGDVEPLRLANGGGAPVPFEVREAPAWLRVDRRSGEVAPGSAVELEVALADGLAEGDYAGSVVVAWGGAAPGELVVGVAGGVEHPPQTGEVQVGSRALLAAGCGLDRTEVGISAADESPVVQVLATTTDGETSGEVGLEPDPDAPGAWVGVLGPFPRSGQVELRVTVVDARGNTAEVDGGTIAVAPCPGG